MKTSSKKILAKQAKTHIFNAYGMIRRVCFSLCFMVCLVLASRGQISLVGHAQLNQTPLSQVSIVVKSGSLVVQTLDTRQQEDFKLKLDHGKDYTVWFRHPKSPVLYMEILSGSIPPEKHELKMGYELSIPFVHKEDDDIDTTVFQAPFFRVVFDGDRKLVGDSAYNSAFARRLFKAKTSGQTGSSRSLTGVAGRGSGAILAGKVFLNGNTQLPVKNKAVTLTGAGGQLLKSTYTNRFGEFVFTGVNVAAVTSVRIHVPDLTSGTQLSLVNSGNASLGLAQSGKSHYEWALSPEQVALLVDNQFTTNIGGKLVSTNGRVKKFHDRKEVLLFNQHRTLIKKTTTNLFGTFVFEDIKPGHVYYIATSDSNNKSFRIDLLSKDDHFIGPLDSLVSGKKAIRIVSNYNKVFNELSVNEAEMKMDIKATIYGDNVNTPIGRLKVILLNDNYEVIDSAVTDNFGSFKFKYLPFLKRFYLSAENTDNVLDVFKNIIIYSNDDHLIKIMTHQKGTRFSYKPVNAELSSMRDLELDDPWLEFVDVKTAPPVRRSLGKADKPLVEKRIVENILFDAGKHEITPQAREILDKIILVLNTNQQLRIEVEAHTDSKGSESFNLKLSQMRARTVEAYISSAGIDAGRIMSKGYGESRLLNHCNDTTPCSELEHAQNRRIEFKISGED